MAYYEDNVVWGTKKSLYDKMGKGATLSKVLSTDGSIYINNGPSRIQDSIYDILVTPIGGRYFLPEYGSRLSELIFEQNDFIVKDLASDYIKEALVKWEPRITVTSVEVTVEKYNIVCEVNYVINSLGMSDSYVYTVNKEIPSLE